MLPPIQVEVIDFDSKPETTWMACQARACVYVCVCVCVCVCAMCVCSWVGHGMAPLAAVLQASGHVAATCSTTGMSFDHLPQCEKMCEDALRMPFTCLSAAALVRAPFVSQRTTTWPDYDSAPLLCFHRFWAFLHGLQWRHVGCLLKEANLIEKQLPHEFRT